VALAELPPEAIAALVAPVLGGRAIDAIEPLEGGLTNTVVKVRAGERALVVRAFARAEAMHRELALCEALRAELPVPDVVLAAPDWLYPALVSRWIPGITLDDCRKREPAALLELAEPLGRVIAAIAAQPVRAAAIALPDRAGLATWLDERIAAACGRGRLDRRSADALRATIAGAELAGFAASGLVHGDLGGRNLLVERRGAWTITGVIDWECAGRGWPAWDVGALFRYAARYSRAFRDAFAAGYRSMGGALGDDWWRAARLVDAARQVASLAEGEHERPYFAECRELIASALS